MDELFQLDPESYGTFGGPREYASAEGRFGGGGWIQTPLAATDPDGKGVVMPPAGADGEKNLTLPGFVGNGPYGSDPILSAVERGATMVGDDSGWF